MDTKAQKILKAIRNDFDTTFSKFIPKREVQIEYLLKKLQHQKRDFSINANKDNDYIDFALDALHFYNLALKELINEAIDLQEELKEREHDARVKIDTIARFL